MNYLLRHSIDDNTRKGGWSDAKLTNKGIALAKEISKIIPKLDIESIVCSDLPRAKETCEIINETLKIPVRYTKELREFNAGVVSGMEYGLIERLYPTRPTDFLNKNFKYPNGETLGEFQNRIEKYFVNTISNSDKTLFVTHRNVISVIYNYINHTTWNFIDKTTIQIPHCSLFAIENNCISRID